MTTLAIVIAASTITASASSKHEDNSHHNNGNVAMMNNNNDRHNGGDRVYNIGRGHRGSNNVVVINNYGRRDRGRNMVRHESPPVRFAHHAHPYIGYRINAMPREARRIYRDHHTYYVYEGYVYNPVVTAAGIIFEAIALASAR